MGGWWCWKSAKLLLFINEIDWSYLYERDQHMYNVSRELLATKWLGFFDNLYRSNDSILKISNLQSQRLTEIQGLSRDHLL